MASSKIRLTQVGFKLMSVQVCASGFLRVTNRSNGMIRMPNISSLGTFNKLWMEKNQQTLDGKKYDAC